MSNSEKLECRRYTLAQKLLHLQPALDSPSTRTASMIIAALKTLIIAHFRSSMSALGEEGDVN